MSQNKKESTTESTRKRKIHWPETILPPINLWNAPLLEHKHKGDRYGRY